RSAGSSPSTRPSSARLRLPAGVEVGAGTGAQPAEAGAVGGHGGVDVADPVPVGHEGEVDVVGRPHRRRLLAAVGGYGVVVAAVGVDDPDVAVGVALGDVGQAAP